MPLGWMVEDKPYGALCHQVRNWFGKNDTHPYWYLYLHVWEEVCLDVDGCIAGDWPGVEDRWMNWAFSDVGSFTGGEGCDYDLFWKESTTFCLEVDIPPELWWQIAASESEDQCRNAKREQDWYWNDIPF